MYYENILEHIHHTPLVKLSSLSARIKRNLFIKMEGANPGGSMKDRVALECIRIAEKKFLLKPNDTIIESTSGSLGVGISLVGNQLGYKVICVVDPKVSSVNLNLMRLFGANIIFVDKKDDYGGYVKARIEKVKEILSNNKNMWWFNQYENFDAPMVHYNFTAKEIFDEMKGDVDWVIAPAGTGSLLAGILRFFREKSPHTKIMGVDACGSVVLGGAPKTRRQVGIGSAFKSNFLRPNELDSIAYVKDKEAFKATRILAKYDGIFVGGSSGSTFAGLLKNLNHTKENERIVLLSADCGYKYMDTVFNDEWAFQKKDFNAKN